MTKHLTRTELITAAKKRTPEIDEHLQACHECQELFSLLVNYDVAGKLRLPDAPAGWIAKAIAVGEPVSAIAAAANKVRTLVAALVFDSWASPQPVGVRGEHTSADRRVRFETDDFTFDLRAEQQNNNWAFVAQVVSKGPTSPNISLQADRKELHVDSSGLYQWTGNRPPKKITLKSDDLLIEIPELSWKKPRLN